MIKSHRAMRRASSGLSKTNNVVLGLAISFSSVLISATQVYLDHQTKEREQEREQLVSEREWRMEVINFITSHQEQIFSEDINKKNRIRDIIPMCFPPEITKKIFQKIENAVNKPIDKAFWEKAEMKKLMIPHATASLIRDAKTSTGKPIYNFSLWIEVPEDYLQQITCIKYIFDHPSFVYDKILSSRNKQNGFLVEYRGWGAINSVSAIIILKNGEQSVITINMFDLINWPKIETTNKEQTKKPSESIVKE